MTKIRKQKQTKNRGIKRQMAGKLLGYSAVAGAALLAGVPTAEALPTVLTGPDNAEFLDLDGNGSDEVRIRVQTGTSLFTSFAVGAAKGLSGAEIAKYSSAVPRAKLFSNTSNIPGGAPKYGVELELARDNGTGKFGGQRGFLGIVFDSPLNGSGLDFGFVDLETSLDAKTVTIYNFGMVGAPAPAPDPVPATVPEPGTLSMLAIGLGGLYAMRRRSEKQKAA